MSDDANSIIRDQETLAGKRYNCDNFWQDIAYRVIPADAQFTTMSEQGQRRTERLFDSNAQRANRQHAAVLDYLLTPRSQKWHMLEGRSDEAKNSNSVKVYLDRLNNALFSMRYAPKANFANQKQVGYIGIGAFGNSFMFIDEEIKDDYRGPRYMTMHMSGVWWAENHRGCPDRFYRKLKWSACAAMKRFGESLPDRIKAAAVSSPLDEFEFLHCVRPNDNLKSARLDYQGMGYESWYIALDQKTVIERSGYRSFPAAIGRYELAPNEIYGRSPAMMCWPAIMTINEQKKTILRAGQRQVDPPLMLTEEGILEAFNMRAGALNYGALSDAGEALVKPLDTGADVPLGLELMQLERQDIDDSFLVSLFRMIQEQNIQTAAQVYELAAQKAMMLAPVMGRLQTEDLGPLINREIDILSRMPGNQWVTQEMPDELMDDGGEYDMQYTSPLAKIIRSQEGVAIARTMDALTAAVAIDPNAAMVLDVPGSLRELAEINGVPAKLIRDEKAVQKMLDDKAVENEEAAIATMAPDVSQANLNAAKAEQIRRTM